MFRQQSMTFQSIMMAIISLASGFTVHARDRFPGSAIFEELPRGIASFGDHVYVYSGHTGKLPSSRIHHRLIGSASGLLVIAGAARAGHLKSVEFVSVQRVEE